MSHRIALLAAAFTLALGAGAGAQTPPAPIGNAPAATAPAAPPAVAAPKAAAKTTAAKPKPSPKPAVITVNLNNKPGMADSAANMGYGVKRTAKAKPAVSITASRHSAKAGEVTFKVTNRSKDTQHEMLVVAVEKRGKPLPTKPDGSVDESQVTIAGKVNGLAAGATADATLTLKPGRYLLLCNDGKHYAAGMWTTFTVTK